MRIAILIALLGATTPDAFNAATPAPIACESLAQMTVRNGQVLASHGTRRSVGPRSN